MRHDTRLDHNRPTYFPLLDKILSMLDNNIPLRNNDWSQDEIAHIEELIPLVITLKPMVYIINVDMASFERKTNRWYIPISEWVQSHGGGTVIPFSVTWEESLIKICSIDDPDRPGAKLHMSKGVYIEMVNPSLKTVRPRVLKIFYHIFGLVTYYDVYANQSKIVSPNTTVADLIGDKKSFIRAEVVAFEDFKTFYEGNNSMEPIKAVGKYRTEDCNYVVQDGDIIFFINSIIYKY